MIANRYLLCHKYIRIIDKFAKANSMDLREALDAFYKSQTYQDMEQGISDMHCRSDEYLVEELRLEINGNPA
jgi:hypothetical protein